jgi:ribosomal protein S18 acetylase RimI-like enzyme
MEAAVQLRVMSDAEWERFRARSITDYAAAHLAAGNWSADVAEREATAALDGLLPDGPQTDGHLVLSAEAGDGQVVGAVWVVLDRSDTGGAWIYDIVVEPERRGEGLGRELLAATEREVARHGAGSLGLNVFGHNQAARALYESAGYETVTLQMRKSLSPDLRGQG